MSAARSTILAGIAATSVWGMMGLGGGGAGKQFLVDAGQSGADARLLIVVVLLGIALTTFVSIFRFVMFGAPSALATWWADNRIFIYAVLGCCLIGGAMYLS